MKGALKMRCIYLLTTCLVNIYYRAAIEGQRPVRENVVGWLNAIHSVNKKLSKENASKTAYRPVITVCVYRSYSSYFIKYWKFHQIKIKTRTVNLCN